MTRLWGEHTLLEHEIIVMWHAIHGKYLRVRWVALISVHCGCNVRVIRLILDTLN